MKKSFFTKTVFAFSIFLCGCSFFSDDSGSSGYIISPVSSSFTYSEDNPIFEILPNATEVVITGEQLKGKSLFFTRMNPRATCVYEADNKGYLSGTGLVVDSKSPLTASEGRGIFSGDEDILENKKICGSSLVEMNSNNFTRANTLAPDSNSSVEINHEIGDNKEFYVLKYDSEGNSSYEKKSLSLIGKSNNCYLWSDGTYDETKADEFLDAGEKIYYYEQEAFGYASDYVFRDDDGNVPKPMEYYSTTGTKLNIVISDFNTTKIEGYTTANDNILLTTYCNPGKNIYINTNPNFSLDSLKITMAHEFLHVIRNRFKSFRPGKFYRLFGTTNLAQYKEDRFFNEMCAVMSEDLMQKILINSNTQCFKEWCTGLNATYLTTGLASDVVNESGGAYPMAFAFGAMLTRNFGGAKVLKELVQIDEIGWESVCTAIKNITGIQYSVEDFMKMFSTVFINNTMDTDKIFTINKDAETSIVIDGYDYPAKAADLWTKEDPWNMSIFSYYNTDVLMNEWRTATKDGKKVIAAYGPALLKTNIYIWQVSKGNIMGIPQTNEHIVLMPYGIIQNYLGKSTENSVTLKFNNVRDVGAKSYIVIK